MTDEHKADSAEQDIASDASHLLSEAESAQLQPEPLATPEPALESESAAEPAEADSDEVQEENETAPPAHLERLQKILAQAGIASRRHAEELIAEGRVQVNGQVVTALGTKADPQRDHIRVDGKLLHGAERLRYFLFNKPRGYVTTVSDPEGRPTVMHFFEKLGERLYPVGRLDFQSEGLLLVTNDGELANNLTRAAHGVEKTYIVKVAGQPSEEMLDRLRGGVAIERGLPGKGNKVRTAPARIQQIRAGQNPWFEVVLIEGRNRELRKMFEEIGHHVEKIRRVGYGPLILDVEPGNFRELDPREVEALRLTAAGKLKPRRVKASHMLPKEAGVSTEERIAKEERRKRPFRPREGGPPRSDRGSFGPPRDRRAEGPAGGRFTRPRTERPFEPRPPLPRPERSEAGAGSFERPSRPRPERPATGGRRFDRPPQDRPARKAFGGRDSRSFDRPARPPFKKADSSSETRPPRPRFGERPAPSQDRPARKAFGGRDSRSFDRPARPPFKKADSSSETRPPRPGFGARPAPSQDRPARKAFGGRESRSFDRPPRKEFGDRSSRSFDRPSKPRFTDRAAQSKDRPAIDRPAKDRPARPPFKKADSGTDTRPSRPRFDKRSSASSEGRPSRPRFAEREGQSEERRPPRPFRKDSGKPSGPGRPARPAGTGRPSGPGRSSGPAGKPRFSGGRSKFSSGTGGQRSGSGRSNFSGKSRSGPPRGGKRPGGKRPG